VSISCPAAGWFDEALDTFQRALTFHLDEPSLYTNLGTLYVKRQQPERALKAYRKAMSLNPNDARLRQSVDRLSRR